MCPPEISPEAELEFGLTKGASRGKTTLPTEGDGRQATRGGSSIEMSGSEPGGLNVELKYWLLRGDSARLILRCVLKARHQSSDNGTKSGIAALRSTCTAY